MTVRRRVFLAAALGLWSSQYLPAQEPGRFTAERATPANLKPSANQQLADTIAAQLRESGQLKGYAIDLVVRAGAVEVTGTVADQPQREETLRIIQGVPGVERVVDRLTVPGSVRRVQAEAPAKEPQPLPKGPELVPPPPTVDTAPDKAPPGGAGPDAPADPGAQTKEPVPIFQAPLPSPYDVNHPKMPPYAWPTYAPYNNYSRVAYPLAYPYQAWPYIGPVYPFPKVPLGWRKVKLEWDDGHWWFSKLATKHDWWRLRYW